MPVSSLWITLLVCILSLQASAWGTLILVRNVPHCWSVKELNTLFVSRFKAEFVEVIGIEETERFAHVRVQFSLASSFNWKQLYLPPSCASGSEHKPIEFASMEAHWGIDRRLWFAGAEEERRFEGPRRNF